MRTGIINIDILMIILREWNRVSKKAVPKGYGWAESYNRHILYG